MVRIQLFSKFLYSVNSRIWVAGAATLSFAFATYNLGHRSLWLDEAMSVFRAQMDWSAFWSILFNREANQALYSLLLKLWIPLGDDEATIRFLSVLFSTACIPIIYLVGKELFDSRAGTTAAFLLGVNGFFIYYAQEARGYTLLVFLALCSSYFAIRCVKSPSRKSWALYIMFSVLAVYAHFFGVWVMLVHAASLFFLPRKMIDWKGIFYSGFIIAICLLPLLIFILNHHGEYLSWISNPTLIKIAYIFNSVVGWPWRFPTPIVGSIYGGIYLFVCGIPIIFLIRSCIKNGFSHNTWRYAFVVCWFYLPIFLVYSFSIMVKPIFMNRYLIIVLPGFILLAAVTLTRFDRIWVSFVASTILVIFTVTMTINSYSKKKENWRGIAEHVNSLSITEDALLFFKKDARIPFDYYLNKANKSSKIFYYTNPSRHYSDLEKPDPPSLNAEWIQKISRRHQRLWLISRPSIETQKLDSLVRWIRKYYVKQQYWNAGKNVHVVLYLNKKENPKLRSAPPSYIK